MPLNIVRGDITKMKVDAIVNLTSSDLRVGSGVCRAVFREAGEKRLPRACKWRVPILIGNAIIKREFKLPAKYIIHALVPTYRNGKHREEALLCAAYTNTLMLAEKKKCKSIAFPLISSSSFGYPREDALRVATDAIRDFLCEYDMNVLLVICDEEAFAVNKKLLSAVKNYVDEHYTDKHHFKSTWLSHRELFQVERKMAYEHLAEERSRMEQCLAPKLQDAEPKIHIEASKTKPLRCRIISYKTRLRTNRRTIPAERARR